jgi:hypothetical protein
VALKSPGNQSINTRGLPSKCRNDLDDKQETN